MAERAGLLQLNRARVALVAVTILSLAALLLVVTTRESDKPGADSATSASRVLEVQLETFDGRPVTLENFVDGTPLVVNFFASWCGPCVREMPDFEAVHQRRGGEVRFVGVNLQDSPGAAADLVSDTGVTYDVLRDESGELFRAVNGFSMPTTVFVDGTGTIVEVRGGELSQGALEQHIDRLLES